MNHRSHENTDHDYNTGIPLPMYVVDGQSEVERLRAVFDAIVARSSDLSGQYTCLVCDSGYYWPFHRPDCPMLAMGIEGAKALPPEA